MFNDKRIVFDLDLTLTLSGETDSYLEALPDLEIIQKLREYSNAGFEIVIFTARNMRTYKGQVGRINVHTLPDILEWLKRYEVPVDEVIVGKPWCGREGFYVDDKAIRPDEFKALSYDSILDLVKVKS